MGKLVTLCTPVQTIRLALRQSGFSSLARVNATPLIKSFQSAVLTESILGISSEDHELLRTVCSATNSPNALWRIKDRKLDLACFTESCFAATFIRTGDFADGYYGLSFEQKGKPEIWACVDSGHANLKAVPLDYPLLFCGTLSQMKENYIKTKRLAPSRATGASQARRGKLLIFPRKP